MVYGLSKLRLEMKKILSEKNCKLSIFRNSTNLNKKKLRKCFFIGVQRAHANWWLEKQQLKIWKEAYEASLKHILGYNDIDNVQYNVQLYMGLFLHYFILQ